MRCSTIWLCIDVNSIGHNRTQRNRHLFLGSPVNPSIFARRQTEEYVKENPKIQGIIESIFLSAIDRVTKDGAIQTISRLYVQLDADAGEIQIFDESEHLLKKKVIFDWADPRNKGAVFLQRKLAMIRSAIARVAAKGAFNYPKCSKPFFISLVDDEFKESEVLFGQKEQSEKGEECLMEGLEKELDDFYRKLFPDME